MFGLLPSLGLLLVNRKRHFDITMAILITMSPLAAFLPFDGHIFLKGIINYILSPYNFTPYLPRKSAQVARKGGQPRSPLISAVAESYNNLIHNVSVGCPHET